MMSDRSGKAGSVNRLAWLSRPARWLHDRFVALSIPEPVAMSMLTTAGSA